MSGRAFEQIFDRVDADSFPQLIGNHHRLPTRWEVPSWRDTLPCPKAKMVRRFVFIVKHMRLHIQLEDDLVEDLDRRAGPRCRSAFIATLIRRSLEDERRWDEIEESLGAIADTGHDWDEDPAEWVRAQRRSDSMRSG